MGDVLVAGVEFEAVAEEVAEVGFEVGFGLVLASRCVLLEGVQLNGFAVGQKCKLV